VKTLKLFMMVVGLAIVLLTLAGMSKIRSIWRKN